MDDDVAIDVLPGQKGVSFYTTLTGQPESVDQGSVGVSDQLHRLLG